MIRPLSQVSNDHLALIATGRYFQFTSDGAVPNEEAIVRGIAAAMLAERMVGEPRSLL